MDAISRVLSDRGEVLDSASPKLGTLRREIKIAHDRLMSRLQKYLTEFGKQAAGADHHPARWALCHPAARGVQRTDQSRCPRSILQRRDLVRGTAARRGTEQPVRELQLQERDEERRILYELSAQIGEHREELIYGVENLAMLDLIFAKAKYAEELKASEPILHQSRKQ